MIEMTSVPQSVTQQRKPSHRRNVPRALRTLVIGSLVALALLAFPSTVGWMTAFWLGWHSYLIMRRRAGWFPLVTCFVILCVKLVARTPAMLVFMAILLLVGVYGYRTREQNLTHFTRAMFLVALWIAWVAMIDEQQRIETCNHPMTLRTDDAQPIVCIGDSLTDGMLPDKGYPEQLRTLVRYPVINEGVSGIATTQALDLMPRVLEHNPVIVVIEVGGHDFLKGYTRASTKTNLVRMIDVCRDNGSEVVLLEIPRGFILDPFASLEREIAYEKDVQLVADTWLRQIVLMSPIAPPGKWMPNSQLSDDGIHSNRRGSHAIAIRVARAINTVLANASPKGDSRSKSPTPW